MVRYVCCRMSKKKSENPVTGYRRGDIIEKTEEEWRRALSPEAYHVLREKGTELPDTGKYNHHKEDGTYLCAGCGNELFLSETKYESGSGWPSFWEPIGEENIETEIDRSLYMLRTGVKCRRCGGISVMCSMMDRNLRGCDTA